MPALFAEELTSPEYAAFVTEATVGVLPVAAIEPHGPHLPLSTDCDIARGHLAQLSHIVGETPDVLILPMQTIGLSGEHSGLPGVFSHPPELLLPAWTGVAESFARAGGRRLVVVSSHGGNSDLVGLLIQRLREEMGLLAVSAGWLRFGQPDGLFDDHELAYGIHGGDVETSLMLHYWPDAVRHEHLADFPSLAEERDAHGLHLRTHGRTRPGWISRDLNPQGVVGNAAAATAEKGARSAAHALASFAELIDDVAGFDLKLLARGAS